MSDINQLSIDALKVIAVEAIDKANSGHPGIVLGAAPLMHTLFTKSMNINPDDSKWIDRDRFILSAGHGSAMLYATLHLSGYDVTIEDLKEFRQLNSRTPGHPEVHFTDGVEATTGPLGQGISNAVGMAIAEAHLHAKFPNLINHYTFVLCGDGDLQEGVAQEAISLAGTLGLNKLIVLYDSNDIQLDSEVKVTNTEKTKGKFLSMNWNYQLLKDGNDIDAIYNAVEKAKKTDKPSLIEVKTIIGLGASNQGTPSVHGAPIKHEEALAMRNSLGGEPFTIPEEVYEFYQKQIEKNGVAKYNKWKQIKQDPLFVSMVEDSIEIDVTKLSKFPLDYNAATRVSSGIILDELSEMNPSLIGGSADLSSSTKIKGADGAFAITHRLGRNIQFGVREHAMAAIANGIGLHGGLRPFCSGFFIFSDYMKPAIRLSALSEIPVIYIFTHDSVAVGEDGPTHQPIEQLAMLRSMPNLNVIRPADANEVKEAYKIALNSKTTPTVIVLTRQNVATLIPEAETKVANGGYIIKDAEEIDGILITAGTELGLALDTQKLLAEENINVRVVHIPSIHLFEKQSEEYKNKVLPPYITKRLAIELSAGIHLQKYVGLYGKVFNINEFGRSGKGEEVQKYFGFEANNIAKEYKKLKKVDIVQYI